MANEVVYIGDALLMFLTSEPERFGVVNPEYVIQQLRANNYPEIDYLITNLSLLNRGYALKSAITSLMLIYNKINSGFEDGYYYMNIFFGGQIPAIYYRDQGNKIPMPEAIEAGLIDRPLNTYEVLYLLNPNWIPLWMIQSFIDLNTQSFNDLDDQTRTYLTNPDLQDQLIQESRIIRNALEQYDRMDLLPDELQMYREYITPNYIKVPE